MHAAKVQVNPGRLTQEEDQGDRTKSRNGEEHADIDITKLETQRKGGEVSIRVLNEEAK